MQGLTKATRSRTRKALLPGDLASPVAEPPTDMARARGGLLGVVGGDQPADLLGRSLVNGSVTTAMLDVAQAYSDSEGRNVPVEVAARHPDVHGPAWLIPVAIARPDPQRRAADTLEMALAAGIDSTALSACVAYVEIAAALFSGEPPSQAIKAATGRGLARHERLELCGHTCADAIAASEWALARESSWCHARCGDVEALLNQVARDTTPGVVAAVAGLVGLHAGASAWPLQWQRHLKAESCLALAPGLLRARGHLVTRPLASHGGRRMTALPRPRVSATRPPAGTSATNPPGWGDHLSLEPGAPRAQRAKAVQV
jgi:hypothetical protein